MTCESGRSRRTRCRPAAFSTCRAHFFCSAGDSDCTSAASVACDAAPSTPARLVSLPPLSCAGRSPRRRARLSWLDRRQRFAHAQPARRQHLLHQLRARARPRKAAHDGHEAATVIYRGLQAVRVEQVHGRLAQLVHLRHRRVHRDVCRVLCVERSRTQALHHTTRNGETFSPSFTVFSREAEDVTMRCLHGVVCIGRVINVHQMCFK